MVVAIRGAMGVFATELESDELPRFIRCLRLALAQAFGGLPCHLELPRERERAIAITRKTRALGVTKSQNELRRRGRLTNERENCEHRKKMWNIADISCVWHDDDDR